MHSFYLFWGISAVVLLVLAALVGYRARFESLDKPTIWGILIDVRERFSLNRFQLVMWTLLILSTFLGLLVYNLGSDPGIALSIPGELLGLLGISIGSTTVAGAVKDYKDTTRPEKIAGGKNYIKRTKVAAWARAKSVSLTPQSPSFSQVFMEEEGSQGNNRTVSISKFQNFVFTLALGIIYVVLTVKAKGYPDLDEKVLWLIGISYSGYVGGKLPNKD